MTTIPGVGRAAHGQSAAASCGGCTAGADRGLGRRRRRCWRGGPVRAGGTRWPGSSIPAVDPTASGG